MLTRFKANLFLPALLLLGLAACDSPPPAEVKAPPPSPRLTHIALGSCNVQLLPQTFWATIADEKPDLFIFGGDNVYGDLEVTDGEVTGRGSRPDLLAAAYAALGANPEFQAFREAVPFQATWDDHDYGKNDAGASYENRLDSERQFLDFWDVPEDDERRARPGIYTSSIHGPIGERVQIILLDTRSFRSDLVKNTGGKPGTEHLNLPTEDLSTTVLGADQWAWLEEEFKKEADVRLIYSSIQVHAQGHRYERWGNFPHELERLYTLIETTRANGIIFLSGDRHSGGLYARRNEGPYPFFEMTSSSLNRPYPNPKEKGPHQLGMMFGEANYATVSFDWENRTVILHIKAINGAAVRTAGIMIDELRAPPAGK